MNFLWLAALLFASFSLLADLHRAEKLENHLQMLRKLFSLDQHQLHQVKLSLQSKLNSTEVPRSNSSLSSSTVESSVATEPIATVEPVPEPVVVEPVATEPASPASTEPEPETTIVTSAVPTFVTVTVTSVISMESPTPTAEGKLEQLLEILLNKLTESERTTAPTQTPTVPTGYEFDDSDTDSDDEDEDTEPGTTWIAPTTTSTSATRTKPHTVYVTRKPIKDSLPARFPETLVATTEAVTTEPVQSPDTYDAREPHTNMNKILNMGRPSNKILVKPQFVHHGTNNPNTNNVYGKPKTANFGHEPEKPISGPKAEHSDKTEDIISYFRKIFPMVKDMIDVPEQSHFDGGTSTSGGISLTSTTVGESMPEATPQFDFSMPHKHRKHHSKHHGHKRKKSRRTMFSQFGQTMTNVAVALREVYPSIIGAVTFAVCLTIL